MRIIIYPSLLSTTYGVCICVKLQVRIVNKEDEMKKGVRYAMTNRRKDGPVEPGPQCCRSAARDRQAHRARKDEEAGARHATAGGGPAPGGPGARGPRIFGGQGTALFSATAPPQDTTNKHTRLRPVHVCLCFNCVCVVLKSA